MPPQTQSSLAPPVQLMKTMSFSENVSSIGSIQWNSNPAQQAQQLNNGQMGNGQMASSQMQGSQMQGSQMQGNQMQGSSMSNSQMQGSQMQGTQIPNGQLTNGQMGNVNIKHPQQQVQNPIQKSHSGTDPFQNL
jgi:uncharacterized protein YjbI with pentapeptide repeats